MYIVCERSVGGQLDAVFFFGPAFLWNRFAPYQDGGSSESVSWSDVREGHFRC